VIGRAQVQSPRTRPPRPYLSRKEGLDFLPVRKGREATQLGVLIQKSMARVGILRQVELAEKTGLSQSTVSRLLYDEIEPEYSTLATLAQFFKIDIETLMTAAKGEPVEMPPFHPLGAELDRMLSPDSGLSEEERADVARLVNMILDQHRDTVRRSRNVG
jgi:transcriptional regulator with XRE-family HTH domain